MALNPFARMTCSWLQTSLCFFFLLTIIPSNSSPSTLSYKDHCSSFVPESSLTTHTIRRSVPDLFTPYFAGGDQLLGGHKNKNDSVYYMGGKSLWLRIKSSCHKTISQGVYKVEGSLSIRSSHRGYSNSSSSYAGYSYHGRSRSSRGSIRFMLAGFWSEASRKLCMVGYSPREADLEVVLKVKFAGEEPNINTSVVSGTLESTRSVTDPRYFNRISIFQFPELSDYSYSLVSGKVVNHSSDSGGVITKSSGSQLVELCPFSFVLVTEYGKDFPVGLSTSFLAMNSIQCSGPEKKLRFMAKLQNESYYLDEEFDHEFALVGEASWDDKKNILSGVACRIFNDDLERSVRDCTMMLSLKYNTIWTLRNKPKVVGEIWSTKKANDSGYFHKVNLTSYHRFVPFPGTRYEYSELGRVNESCPMKNPTEKGNVYPNVHSSNMRFDMSIMNSKGKEIGWGYANPISIGSDLYRQNIMIPYSASAPMTVSVPERSFSISPTNISYKVTVSYVYDEFPILFPNLNHSQLSSSLDITAEGVYNTKNGYLCMVGCRKLTAYVNNSVFISHISTDCEILVKLQFPSLNDTRGGRVKGTIESTRKKGDPFFFENINLLSYGYSIEIAEESIWRMDMEITMVLISNTLSCVFIWLQILHVKRNPEVLPKISLLMIVLLSLGNMVPLVLNFEAVFMENHSKKTLLVSPNGWLEINEAAVRLITMVAFLFQIRLLQLVWAAKRTEARSGEIKSVFVSSPLYILGGLIALLLSLGRKGSYLEHSIWGDLRSYAGLILDGFLFPQILLNVFLGSGEKALAHSFYVGTSGARLVPHAYNQYRMRNYPVIDVNATYYYANPTADFYSTAWDVLIPMGIVGFVGIVFVQQRNGGRWILPRRFRELELYEKVPTVVNE